MPAKPGPPTAPTTPAVAYSYLRFSSAAQADGDSIRRQTVNPEEWCKRNGIMLDTSLRFEDRGRSAFKQHHRHREALTQFRNLVSEGRIPPGSYLIVENLDRLSREQERIAVELLLSIVNAGITVVQLMPEEQVFSPTNLDMLGLMRAVIQLAQAHQESAKKAKRLGEVWGKKRREAIEHKAPLTSRVPGWVDIVDGKFKVNATRAAIVKRIYKLCIAGYGGQATARLLNEEKVPTLTGRGKWYQSAVTYLLRTRAALGEHQPHTVHGEDSRVPVGEPIKGYYPQIITEQTWNAAQGAMSGRITLAGRPPAKRTNIFRGLLLDARGGKSMGITTRSWKDNKGGRGHRGGKLQVYTNNDSHTGAKTYSFPADVLERAILSQLREIDPREVVGESAAAERLLALTGERKELAAEIGRTVDALGGRDSKAITAKILKLEADLRTLDDQTTLARQEAANPLANAWGDLPGLVDVASTADGRVRLAAVLRRVVEGMWCLFASQGRTRIAILQVRFVGSDAARNYIALHEQSAPVGNDRDGKRKMRPARSGVGSLTTEELSGMKRDLRKSADVNLIEEQLADAELVESLWQKVKALKPTQR